MVIRMNRMCVYLILITSSLSCDNAFTPEYTLAWEPPVINRIISNIEIPNPPQVTFGLPVWNYEGATTYIDFNEVKDFYLNSNSMYTGKYETEEPRVWNFAFYLEQKERVQITVMPARLPDEDPKEVMKKYSGTSFFKLRNGGIELANEEFDAGVHAVFFDPLEYSLPSGFYFAKIESETNLRTWGFYMYNSCDEVHPDIWDFAFPYDNLPRHCTE